MPEAPGVELFRCLPGLQSGILFRAECPDVFHTSALCQKSTPDLFCIRTEKLAINDSRSPSDRKTRPGNRA